MFLDSLPERSNTVLLPLQALALQAQDRTPQKQMTMATAKQHSPASFSMDLPHHLHLRLPREHSMALDSSLFSSPCPEAAANCRGGSSAGSQI